jgi:hypothetical protein
MALRDSGWVSNERADIVAQLVPYRALVVIGHLRTKMRSFCFYRKPRAAERDA